MANNRVSGPGGKATFRRRPLLAVDAKGYGSADAVIQRQFQDAIARLLAEAADAAGLDYLRWETQQAGDSVFAVLPEGASEPALVDPFMRTLDAGLRAFNHGRERRAWLRLRAAVHYGSASPGATGFIGRAPVEVGRILDSAVLRAALAAAPDACLAVAVSATVFNDVVREAYTTIWAEEFREVLIEEKEHRGRAWIWLPAGGTHQFDPGAGAGAGAGAGPSAGAGTSPGPVGGPDVGPDPAAVGAAAGPGRSPDPLAAPPLLRRDTVVQEFHGTVNAEGAVFGISN